MAEVLLALRSDYVFFCMCDALTGYEKFVDRKKPTPADL